MDVQLDPRGSLQASWRAELLGGVMVVEAPGYLINAESWADELYRPVNLLDPASRLPIRLVAVPYYAWANREPAAMRVWIPRA